MLACHRRTVGLSRATLDCSHSTLLAMGMSRHHMLVGKLRYSKASTEGLNDEVASGNRV